MLIVTFNSGMQSVCAPDSYAAQWLESFASDIESIVYCSSIEA